MREYPNSIIEDILQQFKAIIGVDYDRYRNHIYRVFSNCILVDNEIRNEDKYAIAAVFHDIGIWTHHTFDYLAPSIEYLNKYLAERGRQDWAEEVSQMVYWHHKLSSYHGNHERTIETFRKADWIDVSLGLLRFGIDKKKIKESRERFPNNGFHFFLLKLTIKNFFKHPLNPIPVFKK